MEHNSDTHTIYVNLAFPFASYTATTDDGPSHTAVH